MINVINIMRTKRIIAENYVSLYWFGQINELIVDKIGCLTKSEMQISKIYDGESFVNLQKSSAIPKKLFENICINSRGRLFADRNE
jgi:magnesium-transporting ATPase (P-type)